MKGIVILHTYPSASRALLLDINSVLTPCLSSVEKAGGEEGEMYDHFDADKEPVHYMKTFYGWKRSSLSSQIKVCILTKRYGLSFDRMFQTVMSFHKYLHMLHAHLCLASAH